MHDASLLTPQAEADACWRLRRRFAGNAVRQMLSEQRLRLTLVLATTALLWVVLFGLALAGFQFLRTTIAHQETYEQTVRAVFGLFFASLMAMLVFSTAIILYGGLFRSRETIFLLTTPLSAHRVFLHKFQEAVIFSSWGFLVLGSPLLVAYGVVAAAPWYYFALIVPYLTAFVQLPGVVGALACLLVVDRVPALLRRGAATLAVFLLLLLAWIGWTLLRRPAGDLLTPEWYCRAGGWRQGCWRPAVAS
jgi:ABC-2 type transport system permease protein